MENNKSSPLILLIVTILVIGLLAGALSIFRTIDGSGLGKETESETIKLDNLPPPSGENTESSGGTTNNGNGTTTMTPVQTIDNQRFVNYYEESTGKNLVGVEISGLKAGTKYRMEWKLDPNFETLSQGYFDTRTVNGQVVPVVVINTAANRETEYIGNTIYPADGKASSLINGAYYEFTLEQSGDIVEFYPIRFDEKDPDTSYQIYQSLQKYIIEVNVYEIGG